MLTAKIRCSVCNRWLTEQQFATYKELAFGVQTMIVGCHAVVPHCNHKLDFKIIGKPDMPDAHELQIYCQAVACRLKKIGWKVNVPIELVGAMVIIFHSGHEGHPLEVSYNSEQWATIPVP